MGCNLCKTSKNSIMKKSRVSGLNTKGLMSNATSAVISGAGAIASLEVGNYIPSTVDPLYVNIGKLAAAALLPTLVKGKANGYAKDFSAGIAAQAALELYSQYTAPAAAAGWDQANLGLAGYDQDHRGLAGFQPEHTSQMDPSHLKVATA